MKGKGREVPPASPASSASATSEPKANTAAPPSSSKITSSTEKAPAPYIVRPSIVERDTTKPPPSLTAAERSTSGISSKKGLDLSAYLPKQLRGTAISKQSLQDVDDEESADDFNEDEADEDSDSDGLYDYGSEDDDEDEDGYHIDDVLAMREAALEYHKKRFELGAGKGTGPLGGDREPDAYDEVSEGLRCEITPLTPETAHADNCRRWRTTYIASGWSNRWRRAQTILQVPTWQFAESSTGHS